MDVAEYSTAFGHQVVASRESQANGRSASTALRRRRVFDYRILDHGERHLYNRPSRRLSCQSLPERPAFGIFGLSNVSSVSSNSLIANQVLKSTSDQLSNQPADDTHHSGAHLRVCCCMNNTFCDVDKALDRLHQSFALSFSRQAQI